MGAIIFGSRDWSVSHVCISLSLSVSLCLSLSLSLALCLSLCLSLSLSLSLSRTGIDAKCSYRHRWPNDACDACALLQVKAEITHCAFIKC